MDPVAAVGLGGGVVLALVWAAANRDHLRRRHRRAEEWSGARPDLWTSAARCPECRAGGGLVEDTADGVRYTCLACGATHRRRSRG